MPKKIIDEFTYLADTGQISRERVRQLRYIRDGKCIRCGNRIQGYKNFCLKHGRDNSERYRKSVGCFRRNKTSKSIRFEQERAAELERQNRIKPRIGLYSFLFQK